MLIGIPLYLIGAELKYYPYHNKDLIHLLFPFTFNNWWFIKVYLQLMLFSPLLNIYVENISKEQLKKTLLWLTAILLFIGGIFHDGLDDRGTNILHFSLLYLIGRYLRLYPSFYNKIDKKILRKKCLSIYFVCSACSMLLAILSSFHKMPFELYSSPFVIVAAVAVFIIFTTFSFQNRTINFMATSALIVYMIHDEAGLSRPMLSALMGKLYMNIGTFYFLLVPLISLLIYGIGTVADIIVIRPLMNLLEIIFCRRDYFSLVRNNIQQRSFYKQL